MKFTWVHCALVLALGLQPLSASAFCDSRSGEVVWSLPAQGDVAVATDADYWPAVLGDSAPTPSLGDVELAPNDLGGFDLGELSPNTTYTIHHPDHDGVPHDIEFTTGAGPGSNSVPPKPVIESVLVSRMRINEELADTCSRILRAQDCYDSGSPKQYQLVDQEQPRAWILRFEANAQSPLFVMPPTCEPSVWIASRLARCMEVAVVTEQGASEFSEPYCEAGVSEDVMTKDESGCGLARRPQNRVTTLAWATALCVLALRRLRQPRGG